MLNLFRALFRTPAPTPVIVRYPAPVADLGEICQQAGNAELLPEKLIAELLDYMSDLTRAHALTTAAITSMARLLAHAFAGEIAYSRIGDMVISAGVNNKLASDERYALRKYLWRCWSVQRMPLRQVGVEAHIAGRQLADSRQYTQHRQPQNPAGNANIHHICRRTRQRIKGHQPAPPALVVEG